MKKGKLLIIDDNEDILFALNLLLEPYMEQIRVATQPERIDHFMRTFIPDIILLDMNFKRDAISGQEGFYWLEKIKKIDPDVVVLFMTAYSDTDKAVRAIKAGATDFIPKPWEKEKLLATLSSALELRESRAEVRNLKKQVEILSSPEDAGFEIIGESEPMQAILRRQRAWQLREVQKTPEGRFAGYYDMVMGFIVGHTVVQAFMDAGVKAYRFIATIDDRTTDECRALHGKVFRMEELKLGINAPPVYPPPHPCRSVIQAVEVADTGQHDIIGRGTGISSDGGALVENAVNVGHINFNDSTQVEEQFRDFIDKNRDSDHESIRIITKSGDVYDILGGQVRINLEGMDDFLDGAKTIHNHPTGYSEYSFSSDRQDDDIPSFFRENGSMMEAFDEKYRYRFNRPANVTLEQWNEAYAASDKIAFEMLDAEGYSLDDDLVTLLQHYKILGTCKSLGIDGSYTRWEF